VHRLIEQSRGNRSLGDSSPSDFRTVEAR
jgi:hypothetical protein